MFLLGINPDSNKAWINSLCFPYQDPKASDKNLSLADRRQITDCLNFS